MSTSAVDSLQNALVDNISGVYLKHVKLIWVRMLVLVLTVPCLIVSLQVRTRAWDRRPSRAWDRRPSRAYDMHASRAWSVRLSARPPAHPPARPPTHLAKAVL